MATMVVETGSGLSTANSYCSVDNADTYHEKHLYATNWTSATDDNKEIALMMATRLLDELVIWNGYRNTTTQALMWPRTAVYDREGYAFSSASVPSWLVQATAEFARQLIAEDRTADPNRDLVGFKEIKVGDLQLKVDSYKAKGAMPAAVWSMVRFYCKKVGRKRRLVRV